MKVKYVKALKYVGPQIVVEAESKEEDAMLAEFFSLTDPMKGFFCAVSRGHEMGRDFDILNFEMMELKYR